jgi:pyruvate formate lyase activating enzyme
MQQLVMTTNPNKTEKSGYIFDIQGLSVHDGPGCRTLIFLCGCTLSCFWCSNPEGISKNPVPMHFISKCILCGNCLNECPKNAIKIENNKHYISRELCSDCEENKCISKCYTDGLKLSGYEISVKKLLDIIQRDRQFWGNNGGITLTGGEPLLQIDFAKEILKLCHKSYIHTAIETCGNIPYKNFQQVIPFLDWIFFDLKHMDPKAHFSGTKSDNYLIIRNAKLLAAEFQGRLIFRFPIIPQFNDSDENIKSIISFLIEIGKNEINILPLHHLGREKYPILNREYCGLDYPTPTEEYLLKLKKNFSDKGINCYLGSNTPF